MGNCICTKCGMEANSKCPYCRSIFPENEYDSMLSHVIKHKMEKDESGDYWLKISMRVPESEVNTYPASHKERAIENLFKTFSSFSEFGLTFEQFACEHNFVFKPGMSSTISCGHMWYVELEEGEVYRMIDDSIAEIVYLYNGEVVFREWLSPTGNCQTPEIKISEKDFRRLVLEKI